MQVDDEVTVDSFLRSLGLEKFAIAFKAEEVRKLYSSALSMLHICYSLLHSPDFIAQKSVFEKLK